MTGGIEFLFWTLLFGLIILLAVLVSAVEGRKRPKSPWLRDFDRRQP